MPNPSMGTGVRCFYSLTREACSGTRLAGPGHGLSSKFLFADARGVQRNDNPASPVRIVDRNNPFLFADARGVQRNMDHGSVIVIVDMAAVSIR